MPSYLTLAKWITAIVLAILGGAFIVRAFDIDKALSSFGRLTPTSFIKIFSIIGGILSYFWPLQTVYRAYLLTCSLLK